MRTYLLIVLVIIFVNLLFQTNAIAATVQWSYQFENTNTVVKKIYADGKGGAAVLVYDDVRSKNVMVWLDKKGNELFKYVGLGMKIIGCNKKNLVFYGVDSEKVYQADRSGQYAEIQADGDTLSVPSCMERYEDKKGFFVSKDTKATAVTELVRYLYK